MSSAPGPNKAGQYDVVYPIGVSPTEVKALAPRLHTLEGKTICELAVEVWKGEAIFSAELDRLEALLPQKYPWLRLIPFRELGITHGVKEKEVVKALPQRLRELGCDAAVSVLGS